MTTKMEKKMIGMFYTLTDEKATWEKKLVEANHRCLDLQYICDDQAKEIERLEGELQKRGGL